MAFLPQKGIYYISKCTKKLLEEKHLLFHPIDGKHVIVTINCKESDKAKKRIKDAQIKAKRDKKEGVLVLSGTQCHLGVTIDNCDIVLL